MRAAGGRSGRDLQTQHQRADLGRLHHHLALGRDLEAGQALDRDFERLHHLGRVHRLQAEHVLDPALLDHARERAAVTDHVDLERRAQVEADGDRDADRNQYAGVDQHARTQGTLDHLLVRPFVGHAVLGREPDQAARVIHLVHHVVAGIDAGAAADALVLQALADVDAGRTDLDAERAVDAGAQIERCRIGRLLARTARLATRFVVGHDHGVAVEHRALEAGVGAHVLADLLAHPAGVAVGGKTVEQDPEGLPRAQGPAGHLAGEQRDRREIADEGKTGPESEQDPDQVLERLAADLGSR